MTRADVIARLKAAEPELRARGVAALYLYGSYARDEAREDSDIDVLVELDPAGDEGLVGYMAPYLYLEGQFPGTEIGYSTSEGLVSHYRPYIERSALRVF
jgi:predicted nucleotidyltransferase